jgi:hypothetical protein
LVINCGKKRPIRSEQAMMTGFDVKQVEPKIGRRYPLVLVLNNG